MDTKEHWQSGRQGSGFLHLMASLLVGRIGLIVQNAIGLYQMSGMVDGIFVHHVEVEICEVKNENA